MFRNSIRIGKIFGIQVAIHYSWFVIFALVLWILATQLFPTPGWYPGLSTATYWIMSVVTTFLFFASVLIHELSHSLVARRRGVPVTSITLFIFGGVSNISREPDSPGMEFAIAFAGPAASFVLGGIFFAIWGVARAAHWPTGVIGVSYYLALVNVILGGFNLVPGFPLDGGRVLRAALWKSSHDLARATRIAANVGRVVGFLIIAYGLYLFIAGFAVSGLWFVLIGWFLEQMSTFGYRQTLMRKTLEGVEVEEVMTRHAISMPAELTLAEAVDRFFLRYSHGAFPVEEGGVVVGMLTSRRVKSLHKSKWEETTVRDAMVPLSPEITCQPSDDLADIMARQEMRMHGRLLVLEDNELVGIITNTDISAFLQRHSGPGQGFGQ